MLKPKDQHIMYWVAREPRITITELSQKTGIPISTVHDRLKAIQEEYELTGNWKVIPSIL